VYRKRYHESERAYKHEIIEEVLKIISSNGGRFLERIDDFENSYWNEVPHSVAYRKIGHAFRSNARRHSMEKAQQQSSENRRRKTIPSSVTVPMANGSFFGGGVGGVMAMGGFGGYSSGGAGPLGLPVGMPIGFSGGPPMFGMMEGMPGPSFIGGMAGSGMNNINMQRSPWMAPEQQQQQHMMMPGSVSAHASDKREMTPNESMQNHMMFRGGPQTMENDPKSTNTGIN
jgi:hypothetical protein